ncbi:hypothetical protein D9757_009685 [Collybiopsis confluens]|uniref:Uncharacterized protein n=1 Tax=Collybiopsis confluens TaxID=2823264 RepID=A0A8H5H1Q0_9AGAR|nr:hypothetical protein D9757_009685 [Collybiopsis confluens]
MDQSFSQEIFDLFIDLFSKSPGDLKVFCLTCKSWLPRARKHLFRRLRIEPCWMAQDQRHSFFESFQSILRNPDIKQCIEVIFIDIFPSRIYPFSTPAGESSVNSSGNDSEMQVAAQGMDRYPCDLDALLGFKDVQSLSFRWGASSRALISGSYHEYVTTLANILRNFEGRLDCLELKDVVIHTPSERYTHMAPALNPFEAIAAFAPSLETLCFTNLSCLSYGQSTSDLSSLQSVLSRPSQAYGTAASEKIISPRRFTIQTDSQCSSRLTYAILFENKFLQLSKLVNLAIEARQIPLFVAKPEVLRSVKHLTLSNTSVYGPARDDSPDQWSYDKARMALPSLETLQFVVNGTGSLLTLCRTIFGPSNAFPITTDPRYFTGEFPGDQFYIDIPPAPPTPTPFLSPFNHRSGLSLHIEFPIKNWTVDRSLAQRTDATLKGYLNLGTPDSDGPLESVSVNKEYMTVLWPLTSATKRLSVQKGDIWWDSTFW